MVADCPPKGFQPWSVKTSSGGDQQSCSITASASLLDEATAAHTEPGRPDDALGHDRRSNRRSRFSDRSQAPGKRPSSWDAGTGCSTRSTISLASPAADCWASARLDTSTDFGKRSASWGSGRSAIDYAARAGAHSEVGGSRGGGVERHMLYSRPGPPLTLEAAASPHTSPSAAGLSSAAVTPASAAAAPPQAPPGASPAQLANGRSPSDGLRQHPPIDPADHLWGRGMFGAGGSALVSAQRKGCFTPVASGTTRVSLAQVLAEEIPSCRALAGSITSPPGRERNSWGLRSSSMPAAQEIAYTRRDEPAGPSGVKRDEGLLTAADLLAWEGVRRPGHSHVRQEAVSPPRPGPEASQAHTAPTNPGTATASTERRGDAATPVAVAAGGRRGPIGMSFNVVRDIVFRRSAVEPKRVQSAWLLPGPGRSSSSAGTLQTPLGVRTSRRLITSRRISPGDDNDLSVAQAAAPAPVRRFSRLLGNCFAPSTATTD